MVKALKLRIYRPGLAILAPVDPHGAEVYMVFKPSSPLGNAPLERVQKRSFVLEDMLREYLPILVFLAVAIGLGVVLLLAALIVAVRNPDPEKVSAYECGFNAFDDARMKLDVRFYLVAILFTIFDL